MYTITPLSNLQIGITEHKRRRDILYSCTHSFHYTSPSNIYIYLLRRQSLVHETYISFIHTPPFYHNPNSTQNKIPACKDVDQENRFPSRARLHVPCRKSLIHQRPSIIHLSSPSFHSLHSRSHMPQGH